MPYSPDFIKRNYVFIDLKKKKIIVFTKGIRFYKDIISLFKTKIQFPDLPQLTLNAITLTVAEYLTGYTHPYYAYLKIIENAEETGKKKTTSQASNPETLQHINSALKEILDCSNNSRSYDIEAIKLKYGLNEYETSMVEQLSEKLANEPFAIELPYSLPDYKTPPPSFRHLFAGTFSDNELFYLQDNSDAIRLFEKNSADRFILLKSYFENPEVTIHVFPDVIEYIFNEFPGIGHPVILNYTMYLLYKMGDKYAEARQYACAVLDIFHQLFMAESSPEAIQRFIKDYSKFLYLVLKPLGLIKTDVSYSLAEISSGAYKLAASDFFKAWLRFDHDWDINRPGIAID